MATLELQRMPAEFRDAILRAVAAEGLTFTDDEKPVAEVRAIPNDGKPKRKRRLGMFPGATVLPDDFNEIEADPEWFGDTP